MKNTKKLQKKFCSVNNLAYLCTVIMKKGKMAEWSNVSHSKCDVGVTLPGVRIPLFPLQVVKCLASFDLQGIFFYKNLSQGKGNGFFLLYLPTNIIEPI